MIYAKRDTVNDILNHVLDNEEKFFFMEENNFMTEKYGRLTALMAVEVDPRFVQYEDINQVGYIYTFVYKTCLFKTRLHRVIITKLEGGDRHTSRIREGDILFNLNTPKSYKREAAEIKALHKHLKDVGCLVKDFDEIRDLIIVNNTLLYGEDKEENE